jgi:hypothetical protein
MASAHTSDLNSKRAALGWAVVLVVLALALGGCNTESELITHGLASDTGWDGSNGGANSSSNNGSNNGNGDAGGMDGGSNNSTPNNSTNNSTPNSSTNNSTPNSSTNNSTPNNSTNNSTPNNSTNNSTPNNNTGGDAGTGGDTGTGGDGGTGGGDGGTGGDSGGGGGDPDIFFVTTNGSDSNDGKTRATAWGTIAASMQKLSSGQTLRVGGGTYEEVIDLSGLAEGSSNDPIVVENIDGEQPVVEGAVRLTGLVYWEWDGIDVTRDPASSDAYNELVYLSDGRGWVFRNAEVWGGHKVSNVRVSGSTSNAGEPGGVSLVDNCIHSVGPDYPQDAPRGDHHNVIIDFPQANGQESAIIERNLIFGAPDGINLNVGGSSSGGHPTNLAIRNNTLYDAGVALTLAYGTSLSFVSDNLLGLATEELSLSTGTTTALIHAYHLSGANTSYGDNYGWNAGKMLHSTQSSNPPTNIGGNIFGAGDPGFDDTTSCDGFHPSDSTASDYGRWAQ